MVSFVSVTVSATTLFLFAMLLHRGDHVSFWIGVLFSLLSTVWLVLSSLVYCHFTYGVWSFSSLLPYFLLSTSTFFFCLLLSCPVSLVYHLHEIKNLIQNNDTNTKCRMKCRCKRKQWQTVTFTAASSLAILVNTSWSRALPHTAQPRSYISHSSASQPQRERVSEHLFSLPFNLVYLLDSFKLKRQI